MKIRTTKGQMEVEAGAVALGLYVTPWIKDGEPVAGWTVSVKTGFSLLYSPVCHRKARDLAIALAMLGDWSQRDIWGPADVTASGIDVAQVRALCRAAEWKPFCDA